MRRQKTLHLDESQSHTQWRADDERLRVRVTNQPAVYPFIGELARRFGCDRIVDFGLAYPAGLGSLAEDFDLMGLAAPEVVAHAREQLLSATLLEWEPDAKLPVKMEGAAVVCSPSEHDAHELLRSVRRQAWEASVIVVSVPAVAPVDFDSLDAELTGETSTTEATAVRDTRIAVLVPGSDTPPPATFSAVAYVTAFNEADLIGSTIEHLTREGIGAYLIDNWSTDGTWEIAQRLDLIGAERFPAEGPSAHYEWKQLLGRVEELGATTRADWLVHIDADERRESPWPGVSLRDGLWRVDQRGFNAVDHTILTFPPIDDGFQPGSDPERYFRHFEFGRNPGHFRQIKAWKRGNNRVDLASEGGHNATFEGRRVFPFNFLTKHYPIRSQEHGERKIFRERQERWSPSERGEGWHIQYDHLRPGHRFVREPETLVPFDDFHRRYLIERLTRVGIPRPEWPPT